MSRGHGVACEEALSDIAPQRVQQVPLSPGLDPLGHDLQAQVVGHGEHGRDEGCVLLGVGQLADERLRSTLIMLKAMSPSRARDDWPVPKSSRCSPRPKLNQSFEDRTGLLRATHDGGLGHIADQAVGSETMPVKQVPDAPR